MIKAGYKFKNVPESLVFVRTGEYFLKRRGGIKYFKYEFAILKYLRGLGFVGIFGFVVNFLIRFITRMSPIFLRRLVYKKIRKL